MGGRALDVTRDTFEGYDVCGSVTASTHRVPRVPRGRVLFAVVAGCVTAYALLAAAVTVAHSRHAVYQLPTEAVATVVVAAVVTILAAWVVVVVPRPQAALLGAVTVGFFVFGLLAIFSIGLLLLVGAVALLVPMMRLLRRASAIPAGASLVTGALLGFGLVVVWVVSSQGPMVECSPNGVSESERAWWGGGLSGSSSGSGSVYPNGSAHGTITTNGHTYTYSCLAGKLVSFRVTLAGAVRAASSD